MEIGKRTEGLWRQGDCAVERFIEVDIYVPNEAEPYFNVWGSEHPNDNEVLMDLRDLDNILFALATGKSTVDV